jgi:hypothetical protein
LHQCVPERVGRDRRYAAARYEPGGDQRFKRGVEVGRRQSRHAAQKLMGEFSTDRSTDLCHILRAKPVETRNERSLQRCRYGKPRKRAVEHVSVAGLT